MDKAVFEEKATILKEKYKAVCQSQGKHWSGIWRNSYDEAYNDARTHRDSSPSHKFHDIKIRKKVSYETSLIS